MAMDDNNILLSMQNICKSFSGVKVLDDVHLQIKFGEVHALVGENGAGKSTLMKILSGVYTSDSGSIHFDGQECKFNNPIDVQNLGITTIHQELFLADTLTIAENIFIGREPSSKIGYINKKSMYKNSKEILGRIGLNIDPSTKVSHINVAQKQMVKIAEALSRKTKLLIMDEPTASLPQHERERLFEIIKQLVSEGISIIYISHHLEEIFTIADRCTILRDGSNVLTKNIKDISMEEIIRAMVGRDVDKYYRQRSTAIDNSKEVLRVENLSTADKLKDISFNVKVGEVVGLAGLMGAGRTELAMTLFGQSQYMGNVYLDDRPVRINSAKDAISLGICYVPEERKVQGIFKHLSVLENMTLPFINEFITNLFITKAKEKKMVDYFVNKFSIKVASFRQPIKYLSGGNQQKIILARWMIKKPKILILDEPTRGIDIGAKVDIHSLISELAEDGVAIILISSDLPELLALSDRILVLKNGYLKGELKQEEANKEKVLSYAAN